MAWNLCSEVCRSLIFVVMDESLTGYEALLRGRELGLTGVVPKVCDGQSQTVLPNVAAQKFNMYISA